MSGLTFMDVRVKGADADEGDSCEEGGGTVFGAERELGHQSGLDGDVILEHRRDECLYILARLGSAGEDFPSDKTCVGCPVSIGGGDDLWTAWLETIGKMASLRSRGVVGLAAKKAVIEAYMNIEDEYREGQVALWRSFLDDIDRLFMAGEKDFSVRKRLSSAVPLV